MGGGEVRGCSLDDRPQLPSNVCTARHRAVLAAAAPRSQTTGHWATTSKAAAALGCTNAALDSHFCVSKMNRQQVAGHLGAANNSNVSAAAQHSSRQQVMAASSGSGRSQSSIAGQIGVTTNPQVSAAAQHAARLSVMDAACRK